MGLRGDALAAEVEAAIERLMADPSAVPTAAEIRAVAREEALPASLTMSEMAAVSGLSADTLRYYEREGLVRVERLPSGHRRFGPAAIERVLLIARMRVSGMPIGQLRELARLLDEGEDDHPQVRALLEAQRERLRRGIAELQLALAVTEFKLDRGVTGASEPSCG